MSVKVTMCYNGQEYQALWPTGTTLATILAAMATACGFTAPSVPTYSIPNRDGVTPWVAAIGTAQVQAQGFVAFAVRVA